MAKFRLEILEGPDNLGRYTYFKYSDAPNRAHCFTCGASRENGCACFNEKTVHAQIFKTPLTKQEMRNAKRRD